MRNRNMKIKEAKTESAEYIVQYFLIQRLYGYTFNNRFYWNFVSI